MKKRRHLLVLAALCFAGAAIAQQTFLAPVYVKKMAREDASPLTVYGTTEDTTNEFPFVRLTGVGSISGQVDSSLSKAARAQFEFYPSPSVSFYASYNRGIKPDTLASGEQVSPHALVFPDASKVGFNFGLNLHWYPGSSKIFWTKEHADSFLVAKEEKFKFFQRPNGNRSHQTRVTAFYQYSYQYRSYYREDSVSPQHYKFNLGTHTMGLKGMYAVQIGKNAIGLMLEGYYSRLDVSRSSIRSFRELFSYVPLKPNKSLPGFYNGFGTQVTVFFNKVGFVFNFLSYRAAADKHLVFDGLTQGQYYIGVTIASDFLTF